MRLTDPRIALPAAPGRRAKVTLAATLGACVLLMSAQARRGRDEPSLLEKSALWLATPLATGTRAVSRQGRAAAESLRSYFGARTENGRLKLRVERQDRELLALRAQAADAARYRALLACRGVFPSVRLAAAIISVERTGAYRRALLSAGSSDGVVPGSPLAVPEGLVGRVVSVSPGLSKAILVTDADCAVGGRVVRTGEEGVVHGDGERLRFDYVGALSSVTPGDIVETAGIDGIFPRGVPIGRVTEVTRGKSLFLTIRIEPLAALSRLSDVLVLDPSPARNAHS